MVTTQPLINSLRERTSRTAESNGLQSADLRGADLHGLQLANCSLSGAILVDTDLRGAHLQRVDLSGSVLTRANLEGARFEQVQFGGADLSYVRAQHARFESVSLVGAEVHHADLRHATLRLCDLSSSSLADSDLRRSTLASCLVEGANLRGARLLWTATLGSSFLNADLTEAKQYFLCREIIAEVLRLELSRDLEPAKMVGAVLTARKHCYAEWQEHLSKHPELLAQALAIFDQHPLSGVAAALRRGRIAAEFGTCDPVGPGDAMDVAPYSPIPTD